MKQFFVAALAAMTVFASCAKDSENNGRDDGVETSMGLTLTFPNASDSRAAVPGNATADEMQVKTITVFLYGTGGVPAEGNMTTLTLSDFTQNGNTYTLNYGSRITTTTGVKSVYVGVNLEELKDAGGTVLLPLSKFMDDGTTTITALSSESELNNFYKTSVADLIDDQDGDNKPGNAFRMFSEVVKTPILVAETDPNWSTNNMVEVDVIRQVSKMTADFAAGKTATTLSQWEVAPAGSGIFYGTHTMMGYYLGQTAKEEMYRYSQFNLDGKRLTSNARTGLGLTPYYRGLNASTVALNANFDLTPAAGSRTSFFGIENVSLNNIRKETTVAVFHAVFVPNKATVYNEALVTGNDPKTGWEDVTWVPANIEAKALDADGDEFDVEPNSFWVVKLNDGDYKFFYSQEASVNFARDYNIDGYSNPQLKGGTLYQKGNTYFYQYLGHGTAPALNYEFARNQYYHLTVEGFKGLGNPGTILPQDPGTDPEYPDVPIEPGEPTPDVPDPDEPTPGNEDETSLRVKVVVKAWDIKVMNGLILE